MPRKLVSALLTLLISQCLLYAEDATDKLARRTVERFFDAWRSGEVDAMLRSADLPWFHNAKEVLKDRERLKREFHKDLSREMDRSSLQLKVQQIVTYQSVRDKLREEERTLADEVVGASDRVVLAFIGRDADKNRGDKVAFLVRIKDGQARIVGLRD